MISGKEAGNQREDLGEMIGDHADYMTELEELYERLKTAKPGKEMREIHKRLRKYGDGIFIWDRYPCYRYVVPILVYIVMLLVFLHMYGAI